VFRHVRDAVTAGLIIQYASATKVATSTPIRVRMAIHTGQIELRDGDYYGRLSTAARGSGHSPKRSGAAFGVTAKLTRATPRAAA